MNTVIIIAPHPDDETMGCGGALLKHKEIGDEINWLLITNIDEKNGWPTEKVIERQNEIDIVAKMYGFTKIFKLDFPTTKLDSFSIIDIIEQISKVFFIVKPNVIYLPNRSDIHTDHQIVFKASYTCTKSFRYPFIKKILMYETLSETEFCPALPEGAFVPNFFVDVSDFFEKKIAIMRIYKSEIMNDNLSRSLENIESLSKFRGSRIGKKYAEAFMLLLQIE